MYAYIKGCLVEKANNFVVVETGGIGYRIFMSDLSISSIGEVGVNVKIYTYYYVREDNISLYGFLSNEELKMFELLLSVSGIGAKSALTMLSNIEPSAFALAVISNDVSLLIKIPGIGNKTAQRLILELRDKLKAEEVSMNKEKIKEEIKVTEELGEAISALQVLGYPRKEIERVLSGVNLTGMSIEDIIKKGLSLLSNN